MIKSFAAWLVYSVFKFSYATRLSEAANFFVYDTIKIFLLLATIIFIVSVIRTFFPPERTRSILSHEKKYIGNVVAALLGIVTPFCTCSAIPLFLGFIEAGVPLGVTFSFLVSSPMVNEVALVMLWGFFGWKIGLIYITSGVIIAIFSGMFIGALKVEELIEHSRINNKASFPIEFFKIGFRDRLKIAKANTIFIVKGIWIFVIIGIGVGAWIHGYVPQDFLARYAGRNNLFSVPLAVLIGIPLYSNASGVIPMVRALVEKGVGMGTALAFMMAVTGLSLPEFLILKKVMRFKLILIFAAVVGSGIIFTGYLFNLIIR